MKWEVDKNDKNIKYAKLECKTIGLVIENTPLVRERIDKIFNLIDLEHLEIINCNFQEIPDRISRLKKLETLNLSQNQLKKLPSQLVKLPNLKKLNLYKNNKLIVSKNLFELKNLEILNLGSTNVEEILDDINKFFSLKELYLSGNNIENIPKSLFLLKKLEILSLDNNKIKEISDEIEEFKSLKILDLRFNNIDKVSKKLVDLNLNELFLGNNPFLIFEELGTGDWKKSLHELFNIHENYQELKKIDLSDLNITRIPSLTQFKDIEILKLSKNNIKEIPQEIIELLALKELDLGSNDIKKIPQNLLNLRNLKILNIANNPVSQIKGFSLKESPSEIIEFLLFNQEKEMTSLSEAKLLVMGDENSGKSSLVERMVHNRFTPEYNSTEGIDISQYPISSDIVRSYCFGSYIESNVKVNIWDFAGQEITYQVHNLFMSKESLYLLVIDGQKEDNIVENFDWLETISANADNPPIIIVVTKHDKNSSYEIDEEKYKEEFPNIEKIHYVSSKENFGFCELKESILLSLSKFTKQKIPKSYEGVKHEIEKKKIDKLKQNKYMLSADEFDDICKDCELLKERDNIRTIFNDIGVMIGLDTDDMHVINPTKMIDEIYKIIRSQKLDDNGELDFKKDRDRHYTWIMKFLYKNKIALKLNNSKVILPSRLPVKRPKGFLKNNYIRDDKIYGLNFRYRYKRFKKSIFFDFIIQIRDEINDVSPQYWANGISWKYDEFQAVVLASKVDRSIDIHISKDTDESRKFLTKIRKKLNEINIGKWGIIQEIAVVDTDDDRMYYKSYGFLKAKQKKDDTEVELNIRGNPKTFELSSLLDRYELIEDEREDNESRPLIFTEGKTDWKHIKKALERFQKDGKYKDLDIEFKEYEDMDMGDAELDRMVQTYCKNKQSKKHIFIFDRDNNKFVTKYGKEEFNNHENNVYSFCIPKISDDLDAICIEWYYKEDDLKTKNNDEKRIFLGKEFLKNGNSTCGKFVTEKRNAKPLDILDRDKSVYLKEDNEWKNNIALSKNDFTNNIINDVGGFDNFDVSSFKLIFDVIEKIFNDELEKD